MAKRQTLKRLGACGKAQKWAARFGSFREAWNACENPGWMLWIMFKAPLCSRDEYNTMEGLTWIDRVRSTNESLTRACNAIRYRAETHPSTWAVD